MHPAKTRMIAMMVAGSWLATASARVIPPYMSWSEDPRTTVTLAWERELPGRGMVHYGTTTNFGTTLYDGACQVRHTFTLRGLQPGARYYYQVESTDGFASDIASFKTAPDGPGSVYRVALMADTQQPYLFTPATNHSFVVAAITNRAPDFYIIVGDLVYDSTWELWDDWFAREKELLARAPIMPCFGNHELFTVPLDASHYRGLFNLPDRPDDGRYYAYTYGNTRFIALNSEMDAASQNEFLALELQSAAYDTNIAWTIVYWHRTVYTWTEKHGRYQPAYQNWVPLVSMYGADFVFSGHNHLYERSGPNRGVYYITTGGGGGDPTNPKNPPGGVVSTTTYHFVELDVTDDVLDFEAIRWDGAVIDTLSLTNRGRIVRVVPAFPQPGEPVRITYDAAQGPLAASSQLYIHLGIDAFAGPVLDEPMTFDAVSGLWFYDTVTPASATQRIAFVFHDESNQWHSNHTFGDPAAPLNWQALLGRARIVPVAPVAGQPATVRYRQALGRITTAGQIYLDAGYNGAAWGADFTLAMTNNPATGTWDATFTVPDHAVRIDYAFHDGAGGRDDNAGIGWTAAITGAVAAPPGRALPVVVPGMPVISDDPASDQNHPGDNMDLDLSGTPLAAPYRDSGFGDFGELYFNYDATNLYVGGLGTSPGGSNNVLVLFLGVDTMADGATTLWHKSGLPNALDYLHNILFTDPMNVAIVYGDEFGDGPAFTNFTHGGYNFGQGIYHVGTSSSSFEPVAGSRLSQFDGAGQVPVTTADDSGDRRTTRWEAALPWTSLGASEGPRSVDCLLVAGVIGSSSVSGNDRYLSASHVAARSYGARNPDGQFGYNFLVLTPFPALMPYADYAADGLPNAWKQRYFGTVFGPPPGEDTDGDAYDNREEYIAGTDPTNAASSLVVEVGASGDGVEVAWPAAAERGYDLLFASDLVAGDWQLITNMPAAGPGPMAVPVANPSASSGAYRLRVHAP